MKSCHHFLLLKLALLLLIGACSLVTIPAGTANVTLTPPGLSAYGFASDYAWLKGQVLITAIQGSCTYLVYDPSGSDPYGGKVILSGNTKDLVNQQWIVAYGAFDTSGVRQVCPGATFTFIMSRFEQEQ